MDIEHQRDAEKEKFKDIKPREERVLPLSSDIEREKIEHEADEEKARLPERPALDLFQAIFDESDAENEDDVPSAGQTISVGKAASPSGNAVIPSGGEVTKTILNGEQTKKPSVKKGPSMPPAAEQSITQFVPVTSNDEPLSLVFHHPLAAMGASVVRTQGTSQIVDVAVRMDEDDDWEEVSTAPKKVGLLQLK